MNIKVMDAEEAAKLLRRKPYNNTYAEVYDAVDALEKGKAIVIEMEDAKRATMCAQAISFHVNHDNKAKCGRFYGCYYSKTGSIIVIGKN